MNDLISTAEHQEDEQAFEDPPLEPRAENISRSLSELIESFCNQRKNGRLKISYPKGAGYFFLSDGSVINARIGVLRGIEAIYYALTLPDSEFEFTDSKEVGERTIEQPWAQVLLEGLRRLDNGIEPGEAFPPKPPRTFASDELVEEDSSAINPKWDLPPFLSSQPIAPAASRKPLIVAVVVVALIGSAVVIGLPSGWYDRSNSSDSREATGVAPVDEVDTAVPSGPSPIEPEESKSPEPPGRRHRGKERRGLQGQPSEQIPVSNYSPSESDERSKTVVVTVTYDELGRVTQASGSDPAAVRIARQRRFPPGKRGSTNVTIPIN